LGLEESEGVTRCLSEGEWAGKNRGGSSIGGGGGGAQVIALAEAKGKGIVLRGAKVCGGAPQGGMGRIVGIGKAGFS